MQLTRAADYALRVMIHLAEAPPGARARREELAEASEVPPQFMAKVLQAMSRADLITSHRGIHGGFELARPANRITVLDVVEAIEGPLCLNTCLAQDARCGRLWWCGGHDVWKQAQAAMMRVLQRATLARLAEDSRARRAGTAPPIPAPLEQIWN
ncbi:MAG: Rrf2 family transcriptional regulator [Bryobacterales bacterium]|nr:Rrf2 family transcriptional regulator [Bryobacterales bacterium]